MRFLGYFVFAVAAAGLAACAQFVDPPEKLAPAVLEQSVDTMASFRGSAELKEIDQHIGDAAGILILPRVVKGGLIGAAEAGTGVLLARRAGSEWSYPVFYLLSAGSVGLQAGLQETSVIMVIKTQEALDAMVEHQGKFGADVGVTVGWAGKGVEAATTMSGGYDVLAFSAAGLGLFGGVSLEGAALVRRSDMNAALYGAEASPRDILFGGAYSNPVADPLRAAINPR